MILYSILVIEGGGHLSISNSRFHCGRGSRLARRRFTTSRRIRGRGREAPPMPTQISVSSSGGFRPEPVWRRCNQDTRPEDAVGYPSGLGRLQLLPKAPGRPWRPTPSTAAATRAHIRAHDPHRAQLRARQHDPCAHRRWLSQRAAARARGRNGESDGQGGCRLWGYFLCCPRRRGSAREGVGPLHGQRLLVTGGARTFTRAAAPALLIGGAAVDRRRAYSLISRSPSSASASTRSAWLK